MALETITVVLLILGALAGLAFVVLWVPRALYRSLIQPRVDEHPSLRWVFWLTVAGITMTGGLLLRSAENLSSRDWIYALIAAGLTLFLDGLLLYAEFRAQPAAVEKDSDPVWPARNELVRGSEPIEPE